MFDPVRSPVDGIYMHNHLAKIFSDQHGATRRNIRPCPVNGGGPARFRGTPQLLRGL
jgi:hypothetical protein